MVNFRQAVKEDSTDIARLFLISSGGIAEYIWSMATEPGETVIEAGARRYGREAVAFSYENCIIAEQDGDIVGMALSFGMAENPDAEPVSDPVLKPFSELEDYGSLYLSGLAVVEQHRGSGIGNALMETVNERAKSLSLPRVSLIVFERNVGALKLYRRLGFRELDRRAVVPHPVLQYQDGDLLLLARDI